MIYIVTGVSRGIGKAVTELLLTSEKKVIGLGRSSSIKHRNFTFLQVDLANSEQISHLKFEFGNEPVTLINNAAIIGTIRRISEQKSLDLEEVLKVNTIAPMLLTHRIYSSIKDKKGFTLVNISSGAANRAIPSWSAYCASKAALNMLTETFYLEELEKGNKIKVYAVSPGVVDTEMQEKIRSVSELEFSQVHNFRQLKKTNQLFSSREVATRLLHLLNEPFTGNIFKDLRNQ